MEFKRINIKNFECYYGEENEIIFSPYTTIILGQNTSGKSKFFDSINWVLYARIYNVDTYSWMESYESFQNILLNKKAILEAIESKKQTLDVSVELEIEEGDKTILITRTYIYSYISEKFKLTNRDLAVSVIQSGTCTDDFSGSEAQTYIIKMFPSKLRDFFLFQGEAASSILKLHKDSKFTEAVKTIAKLERFEKANKVAEEYESNCEAVITKEMRNNKKTADEQESLTDNIEIVKIEIENIQSKIDSQKVIESDTQEKINEAEALLQTNADFQKQFQEREDLKRTQLSLQCQEALIKDSKIELVDNWVFYKIKDKIESFADFYKNLEKQGDVPPSISQEEVKKAIKQCKCTICGTSLQPGSPARQIAESKILACDTDELGNQLKSLNAQFDNTKSDLAHVKEKIASYTENKAKNQKLRDSIKTQLEDLNHKLDTLVITEEQTKTKKELEKAQETIRVNRPINEKAKREIIIQENNLKNKKVLLEKRKDRLQELANQRTSDIDEAKRIELCYAKKLRITMQSLSEKINDIAYGNIEKAANDYYHEMTKENKSCVGTVKIDFKNSDIYTVNEMGERIQNINQANRVSIQLAVIAGILTVASDEFGEQYPFVTDAPISDLGGDNKIPTINCMINAFEQAIIILKDDARSDNKSDDEVRKLILSEKSITKAYELDVERNEKNTDKQFIKITTIKDEK